MLMKIFFLVFIVALALSLVWEHLHFPLYDCSAGCSVRTLALFPSVPLLVKASVFDAFFITLLYCLISIVHQNRNWVRWWNLGDTLLILGIGFSATALLEHNALALHKWAYTTAMPIVPFLDIGLSPFVQLALLALTTYTIVEKLETFFSN
ncbi:MAG: hypothetical protein G01um101448_748 [Parcubacteria group bacterium Gr01-1014_48]|nr:MAG: hypothetical protein Greene041614_539 [Parcubacteria group bacterium Greene0416_14]TSC73480.1 MAG: hypothetical protein G01um101448_748 [Parcubacteria group bacterium Gr01-1014_48]TSD00553.1 MAG: hypothetical protein Greene101415_774 [Parcubacteria group bacterium Greene1014_15]TSD08246.1 MAG: hypothetical protein Greene07144_228 [Parcubacteria group bacterium Greene0714_4]